MNFPFYSLYTYGIRDSQEIEKTLSQGKKAKKESNRGGSLSRMDRSKRCHVTRMNSVTE